MIRALEHLGIYDDDDNDALLLGHLDHDPHPNTLADYDADPRLVPQLLKFRPYHVDEPGPAPALQWENGLPVMHVPMIIPPTVPANIELVTIYDKITSECKALMGME